VARSSVRRGNAVRRDDLRERKPLPARNGKLSIRNSPDAQPQTLWSTKMNKRPTERQWPSLERRAKTSRNRGAPGAGGASVGQSTFSRCQTARTDHRRDPIAGLGSAVSREIAKAEILRRMECAKHAQTGRRVRLLERVGLPDLHRDFDR
jgi:hypothetical protein